MRRTLLTMLGAIGVLVGSNARGSVISNAAAIADAFVTTGPTNNLTSSNYGAAGALSAAAPGKSQGEFQSLIKFDLSGSKEAFDAAYGEGNWTISSVTLQLTAAAPSNAIFNASSAGAFAVSWLQNDGWFEGSGNPNTPGITGVNFSSLGGLVSGSDESLGSISYDGATSGATSYTLSLTPNFLSDVTAGSEVSLRILAGDANVSYLFNSRNFGTASARPFLTVTAVPEPAFAGMAGILLLTVGRRARR